MMHKMIFFLLFATSTFAQTRGNTSTPIPVIDQNPQNFIIETCSPQELSDSFHYIGFFIGKLTDVIVERSYVRNLLDTFVTEHFEQLNTENIRVAYCEGITASSLIRFLQTPSIQWVTWYGHSSYEADQTKKPIAVYYVTEDGRRLAYPIFTAAHPGLRFFGYVSCEVPTLLKKYFDPYADRLTFERFDPQSFAAMNLQSGDQLEGSSRGEFRKLVGEILAKKISELHSETPDFVYPDLQIRVKYQDLLSDFFDYEVWWNDRMIGVLTQDSNGLGIPKIHMTQEMVLPGWLYANRPEGLLKIIPFKRRSVPGLEAEMDSPQSPVDNILIKHIQIIGSSSKQTLLNDPVNVGDVSADETYDQSPYQSFKRLKPRLEKSPVFPILEIPVVLEKKLYE